MSKICTLDIVNGYVINQIRLEAGYKKQGELGEKFGMSHAAVGKIERGESSVSLEFLTILAEMTGLIEQVIQIFIILNLTGAIIQINS